MYKQEGVLTIYWQQKCKMRLNYTMYIHSYPIKNDHPSPAFSFFPSPPIIITDYQVFNELDQFD